MARARKVLVEASKEAVVGSKKQQQKEEQKKRSIKYLELVNKVRKSRSTVRSNDAFNEIVKLLRTKLEQISYKVKIPGFTHDDIYQEALYALRYKAVKDYDKDRSTQTDISPFDKFAVLCIRRHLYTKLKSSYQNRQRIWLCSISLDQDRNGSSSDDALFLIDIITDSKSSILDDLDNKEYYRRLFTKLFDKLSDFEKSVFLLYCQKLSYQEIVEKIRQTYREKTNVKSVDNALSRIKLKAKEVFDKFGNR